MQMNFTTNDNFLCNSVLPLLYVNSCMYGCIRFWGRDNFLYNISDRTDKKASGHKVDQIRGDIGRLKMRVASIERTLDQLSIGTIFSSNIRVNRIIALFGR